MFIWLDHLFVKSSCCTALNKLLTMGELSVSCNGYRFRLSSGIIHTRSILLLSNNISNILLIVLFKLSNSAQSIICSAISSPAVCTTLPDSAQLLVLLVQCLPILLCLIHWGFHILASVSNSTVNDLYYKAVSTHINYVFV